MELSVKPVAKYKHLKAVCHSHPGIKSQGHEQSKDRWQKKRENIHAIYTAEQSAEIPLSENTNTPHMLDTPQLYFHSLYVNSISENDTQALLQLQVNSGQVTAPLLCKIDTGAEGNVIPVDVYNHLCPQSSYSPEGAPLGLTPSNTTITTFGGHTIPQYGICELTLSHHSHSKLYAFHVVNTVGPTILGLPTCCDMKLVTLDYGISTTQTETVPTAVCQITRQCRCKVRASLPISGLLSGNWVLPRGVSHHPRPHGSNSHPPTTACT